MLRCIEAFLPCIIAEIDLKERVRRRAIMYFLMQELQGSEEGLSAPSHSRSYFNTILVVCCKRIMCMRSARLRRTKTSSAEEEGLLPLLESDGGRIARHESSPPLRMVCEEQGQGFVQDHMSRHSKNRPAQLSDCFKTRAEYFECSKL